MRWRRVAPVGGESSGLHSAAGEPLTVSDEMVASAFEDLEAGLTPIEVLDRYPEFAAELAPLLQTAYELRLTRWPVMSVGGRVTARERMHAALAEQKRRRAGFLPPFWRQVGVTLALVVMASGVFLASPLSPLDFSRQGRGVTPTVDAPAIVAPTSATVDALPTVQPTETEPATAPPTRAPTANVEPSETPERLVLAEELRPTATLTRTATPTRRPTRTSTVTLTPTATVSVTATATAEGGAAGEATQPPSSPTRLSATITPQPTATPGKPSPTLTVRPTEPPEPTASPTALPTATQTPQPQITPAPTASETPKPTKTPEPPEPTRTPRHTPRPSDTPGPTRTPRIGNALPEAPQLRLAAEARPIPSLQQQQRAVIQSVRSSTRPGKHP